MAGKAFAYGIRMKFKKTVFLALMGVSISACGSRSKVTSEAESASSLGVEIADRAPGPSHVGEKLALRIVGASEEDTSIPDLEGRVKADSAHDAKRSGQYNPNSNSEFIVSGNQVEYERTLPLEVGNKKQVRSYFLVWDDSTFGKAITIANYRTQKSDAYNRPKQSDEVFSAVHDDLHQIWYVPLRKAIPDAPEDIDPTVHYTVIISIVFADGVRTEAHVRFQMNGVLPRFSQQVIGLDDLHDSNPLTSVAQLNEGKLIAQSVIIANSAKRPFKVWFKPQGDLTFHTFARVSRCESHEHAGPTFHPEYSQFIAPVETETVHVEHVSYSPNEKMDVFDGLAKTAKDEDFEINRMQLSSNEPLFFYIGPQEKVKIDSKVRAKASEKACALPEARTLTPRWSTARQVYSGHSGGGESEGGYHEVWDSHDQQVTEAWSVVGWSMKGEFQNQIKIAEPSLQSEDIFKNSEVSQGRFVSVDSPKFQASAGDNPGVSVSSFSCQGVPSI